MSSGPCGRIGISDLVADDHLTTEDRARLGTHADCIAGALTTAEYTGQLAEAGFTEITLTHSATPSPRGCTPPSSERPNRSRRHLLSQA